LQRNIWNTYVYDIKFNNKCGDLTTALKFQNGVLFSLSDILNCLHYFWLISCSGNAVPEGFENEETLDVSLRAEQSTLEDYDNIPVEKVNINSQGSFVSSVVILKIFKIKQYWACSD